MNKWLKIVLSGLVVCLFTPFASAENVGVGFIDEFIEAENIVVAELEENEGEWSLDVEEVWKGEMEVDKSLLIESSEDYNEGDLFLMAMKGEDNIIVKIMVGREEGLIVPVDNNFELFLDDSVIATLNDYVLSQGENDLANYSFENNKVFFNDGEVSTQIYPTQKDYLAVVALIGMVVVLCVIGLRAVWVSLSAPVIRD